MFGLLESINAEVALLQVFYWHRTYSLGTDLNVRICEYRFKTGLNRRFAGIQKRQPLVHWNQGSKLIEPLSKTYFLYTKGDLKMFTQKFLNTSTAFALSLVMGAPVSGLAAAQTLPCKNLTITHLGYG